MSFDLVIRNGTIVDGTGSPSYKANVGITGNRIVRIGRFSEKGREEIDAEGHAVTPGFIDGHTHMDAQVFWDSQGSCSCWHGVTSAVMGNCGFTLAPIRTNEEDLVVSNLERAEDLSGAAMAAGIKWTWETFPEYLDAVDAQPKAINYAASIGHSAVRTFAMGERAFSEEATEDDIEVMVQTIRDALCAGAIGFSTSFSETHARMDGRPIASRLASWDEVRHLVSALSTEGAGVFQTAPHTFPEGKDNFEEAMADEYNRYRDLAISSGVPITYGLRPKELSMQLGALDEAAKRGGNMFAMSRCRAPNLIFSFKSQMPYDRLPEWTEFRALPLEEQRKTLQDPLRRSRLKAVVDEVLGTGGYTNLVSQHAYKEALPSFEVLQVMREGMPNQSVASLAKERGTDPLDLIFDLTVETNFEQVFGRLSISGWTEEHMYTAMKHPRTVMTFSDSGAHVSFSSGADLQTSMLASWVRERQEFTFEEAIRMMTLVPALYWQLPDRGIVRVGAIADLNVIDPLTVGLRAPTIETDLPAGALRVKQKATGYLATVVGGQQTFSNGEYTGAIPGRLIRGPLAAANL